MDAFLSNEEARDHHAVRILARIDEDCRAAPPLIRPILEYVEDHLWDPNLITVVARRTATERQLMACFCKTFGCRPRAYIRNLRMSVAAILLELTDIVPQEVGRVVCYATTKDFYHHFQVWSGGIGPRQWQQRAAGKVVSLKPTSLEREPRNWRRALTLSLSLEEEAEEPGALPGMALCTALLRFVMRATPCGSLDDSTAGLGCEISKVVLVWTRLKNLPVRLQRQAVRYPIPMKSLLLFEVLSHLSQAASDGDTARHLADLALYSLDACEGLPPERLSVARCQAWLRLCRLALSADDTVAAERAAALASAECASCTSPPPEVEAELAERQAELALASGDEKLE
jgi:AraC-like DNA-binding protein